MLCENQNNPYYIRCIYVKEKPCFMRFSRHYALLTRLEICCRIANTESFSEHIMADGCSNSYCNSACQCNDIYSRCTYITIENYQSRTEIFRVVIPSCCCACATVFLLCPYSFITLTVDVRKKPMSIGV